MNPVEQRIAMYVWSLLCQAAKVEVLEAEVARLQGLLNASPKEVWSNGA